MTGSATRRAAAAAGVALLLAAAGGHAQAAAGATLPPPKAATTSVGLPRVGADADAKQTRWATCTAGPNSPHWSKGAQSVIFKTRVSCKGNIARVHVQVRGQLLFCPGTCPPSVRATSNETKVLATNGSPSTYYTPKVGGKKVRGDGKYQGKVTVRITSPFPGSTGSASSKMVFVNTP